MLNLSRLHNNFSNLYSFFPRYLNKNGFAFPPLKVTFAVTRKCNQRCEMCHFSSRESSARSEKQSDFELTFTEFTSIIKQIPSYCLISFTGGEPFIRSDFMEIFEEACKYHKVMLISNGTLMNEERIKRLIKASLRNFFWNGLFLLDISIHGLQEEHDAITQTEGSFEKVCENIKMFQYYKKRKGVKFPLLDLKAVILQKNADSLSKIFKLAEDLEFNSCTFRLFRYQFSPDRVYLNIDGERAPNYDLLERIDFPQIDILRNELEKIKEMSMASKVKLRFLPDLQISEIIKHYSSKQEILEYKCHSPWMSFNVNPQGIVIPCYYYGVGDARKESFKEIWKGKKFRRFRCQLKNKGIFPACMGCSLLIQN